MKHDNFYLHNNTKDANSHLNSGTKELSIQKAFAKAEYPMSPLHITTIAAMHGLLCFLVRISPATNQQTVT